MNFDKIDGEIHDINCKIEKMDQGMANNTFTINSLCERLLALERYSRGFNLRFYKVPGHIDEDCTVAFGKIISKNLKQGLSKNLKQKPVIENAHRIGPFRDDGSPRPISLIRPERRSLHDRRFMSQAGRTRYFARRATGARSTRRARGEEKNKALIN